MSCSKENVAERCARIIENSNFLVALTGAGISTNAGIPDFRGPCGIYTTQKYGPEYVFHIDYFTRNPQPFYRFARDFFKIIDEAKPTFCHFFLAKLEEKGRLKGVITQNIDFLHQKAGSRKVIELHGNFLKSFCLECGREFHLEIMRRKIFEEEVPRCICGGLIKPDIVFFGEMVKNLDVAEKLASSSDLLLVIGSSLTIYPAAGIPEVARGKIIIVNKERVNFSPFERVIFYREDVDSFLKKVAEHLSL
ncbi:RNA polymerase subunit sigma [Candidatus Aerophobetes bacterium]|nr:RNA polymerase subunit sigma [Candidatus Aerophobetes bacterium]